MSKERDTLDGIIAATGVAEDEDVRAATKELVISAINEANRLIEVGSPAVKGPLIRAIATLATKSLQENRKESEEIAELRGQFTDLMKEVRGTNPTSQ